MAINPKDDMASQDSRLDRDFDRRTPNTVREQDREASMSSRNKNDRWASGKAGGETRRWASGSPGGNTDSYRSARPKMEDGE